MSLQSSGDLEDFVGEVFKLTCPRESVPAAKFLIASEPALSQQMDELVAELGPEYTALNEGLEDIDPNSKDSTDIASALAALDKLCAK